jgi:hypothetical protein
MILYGKYETQKSSVAVACFLPDRAKGLSAPLVYRIKTLYLRTYFKYLRI